MSWFKGAGKKIEEGIGKVKKGVRGLNAELNDESPVHKSVQNLYTRIETVFNREKEDLPQDVKEAARGMLRELRGLLDADSKNGWAKAPKFQHQLAEQAIEVIHKYQPKMEASPGFFNRIAAHINNFIEELTGYKDLFEVEKSEFGADAEVQKYKDSIRGLKADLENRAQQREEEDRGYTP